MQNAIAPDGTVVRSGAGLSGIRYPLGRDRKTNILSFKQYIRLSSWEHIQRFIQEDLFPTMDDFWSKAEEGEFRWRRYDFLLPANFEVKYDSEMVDFDVELSTENWQQELSQVNIGTNIKLSNFKIVEIENSEIVLNLSDEKLRIKIILPQGTTINRDVLQSKKTFLGKVIKTRHSIILEKLHKAYEQSGFDKFDSDSAKITLPGNIQLGNPLSKLTTMLSYRSDVNTSPVHGDLNLENILVESSPPPECILKGLL